VTIATQDLRKIESSLKTILQNDFWSASDSEVETFTNDLRKCLCDRNVKIEIEDSPVVVQFPVALVEVTKMKVPQRSTKLSE
jgi:hypothetical protein